MLFPQADLGLLNTLERHWPIGSVYIGATDTSPADLFGFGTWEAFGAGRVLVGLDAGQAEFDTLLATGGAKEVTLAEAQLPAHTHVITDPGHAHIENSNNTSAGALRGWGAPDASTNQSTATGYSTATATTGITLDPAGSGDAHPNLQPYVVVRFWRRVG